MINLLLNTLVATMFAMQAASTPATPAPTPASVAPVDKTPLRLSGCVARDGVAPSAFTFAQTGTDMKYRLGGVGAQKYVGQRVEIVGAPIKHGLAVSGGLVPSPNVAAQAGAIDPVKAAIASQPGGPSNGIGVVGLPEFRVTHIRGLGPCQ